ncbi:MAG: hypothetical protein V3T39_00980, partial [Gammaproteobacteria bacterium]
NPEPGILSACIKTQDLEIPSACIKTQDLEIPKHELKTQRLENLKHVLDPHDYCHVNRRGGGREKAAIIDSLRCILTEIFE